MVRVHALAMIGQHFDDTALGEAPVAAALDHHFQLGLERR